MLDEKRGEGLHGRSDQCRSVWDTVLDEAVQRAVPRLPSGR